MAQLATAEMADAFQLLPEAGSPLVEAATHASSSSEGGLLVCLLGQRLNSSAVPPAVALGAAACPLQSVNDTAVCCLTPAQPVGFVNVSVLLQDVGYALLQPAVPQPFEYTAPPQLLGIAPAIGHAGSTVEIVGIVAKATAVKGWRGAQRRLRRHFWVSALSSLYTNPILNNILGST